MANRNSRNCFLIYFPNWIGEFLVRGFFFCIDFWRVLQPNIICNGRFGYMVRRMMIDWNWQHHRNDLIFNCEWAPLSKYEFCKFLIIVLLWRDRNTHRAVAAVADWKNWMISAIIDAINLSSYHQNICLTQMKKLKIRELSLSNHTICCPVWMLNKLSKHIWCSSTRNRTPLKTFVSCYAK